MLLTPKQKQILDYIKKYIKEKDYSPSYEEVAKHFKIKKPTVYQYVETLIEKGYLKKDDYKARSIKLNIGQIMFQIPLLGEIIAGKPLEMFEQKETIAVPDNKLPKSGEIFALRVVGNSMVDENINNGDIVLIKKQNTAENGQKVVALIDNSETTLKKFYRERNFIRLQPANKKFEPIIINKNRKFDIQGIVIDVINSINTEQKGKVNQNEKFPELPIDQIICGDAIEIMKKIPDNSVDITFADPPFNLNKKYGNYKDKKSEEEYIKWCEQWLTEMVRITKPTGSILVHNIPKWLIYYANHLNKIAFFKHWVTWDSMSIPLGKTLLPAHYGILFYTKSQKGFKFNELRSPHKKCPHCNGMIKDYGGKKSQINPLGALLSDVWTDIHRIRHKNRRDEHPCQLPEPLLERLILMTTNEKDIVLDPFIGAGTTASAAKRLGRHFIGIDIDPKYKSIIENKIKNVSYRLTNGYVYNHNGKTSKYLKNLTISEKEGVYPLDNPLFFKFN
ncbi:MAG: transcriptional repressor LexA [Patescibacteria group bacterium]